MTVRELVTYLGFKVELGPLRQYEAEVDQAKRKSENLSHSSNNFGRNLLIGAGLAATGIGFLAKSVLDLGGSLEATTVAFSVMLGGGPEGDKRAKEMLATLQKIADTTPYESKDLQDATKVMMQFGISADDSLVLIRQLGDVAMGDKNKLQSLALVMGQVDSAGKLQGQDLLQLINAGFNPLQVISQKTGKSMGQLRAEMEKGAISADMVRQAFADATGPGGRFYQMSDKISQTWPGLTSTFMDFIHGILRGVGEQLLPVAKEFLGAMNDWLGANKELISGGLVEFLRGVAYVLGYIWVIGEAIQLKMKELGVTGEKLGSAWNKLWKGIMQIIKPLIPVFVDLVATLFSLFGPLVDMLTPLFSLVGKIVSGVAAFLQYLIPLISMGLKSTFEGIGGIFMILDALLEGLIVTVRTAYTWLVTGFQVASQLVEDAWNGTVAFFQGLWDGILGGAKVVWEALQNGFKGALQWVSDMATGIFKSIAEQFDFIQKSVGTILGWIGIKTGGAPSSAPTPGLASTAVPKSSMGMPTSVTTNQVTIDSKPTIVVPPGTSQEQAKSLQDQAKTVVKTEWEKYMKEAASFYVPAEAGRR